MKSEARLFALVSFIFSFNSIILQHQVVLNVEETIDEAPSTSISTEQLSDLARQCSSKELDVPFPYATCTLKDTVKSLSSNSHTTCGFCHQNAWVSALEDLSLRLEHLVGDSCSEIITYGAALGSRYEDMLEDQVECSFMFLLEDDQQDQNATQTKAPKAPHLRIVEDGEGYVIRIPPKILPYDNNRRNTKLLKMFGGLKVFSFAKRIVWQDAKLDAYIEDRNYTSFFHENIDSTGACSSFRSMPNHINTVGIDPMENWGPRFRDHCNVLLRIKRKRSPITDSRDAIRHQCKIYERQQNETSLQTSLDSGMIDSALILWDMRSERCRDFNLKLSCTWLDETQCYGDRDQISFPQALRSMEVHEGSVVAPAESMARDKLFLTSKKDPAVHFSRGACHWYFIEDLDLMECKNNIYREFHVPSKRIAIVTAGGLLRFNFNSTTHHLIEPLVRQGHQVDYYLSLSSSVQKAYRASLEYMNHLTLDPVLPQTDNVTVTADFIRQQVTQSGGNPRQVHFDRSLDVNKHPMLVERRKTAKEKRPDENADLRFPMLDLRSHSSRARTKAGNKNMFALFYNIRSLWNDLVETENEEGFQYDYVMFLRDDAMWLMDFDFNDMISREKPSTEVFTLSCDARRPTMHPMEINDHIAIATRQRAELFGNYFEHLFDDIVTECSDQLDDDDFTVSGFRGCNSEMILRWILENKGVEIASVGQAVIPFERSLHVETESGDVEPCFHKFCQSYDMPIHNYGIERCVDMFVEESDD